jgi:hypothetical protein
MVFCGFTSVVLRLLVYACISCVDELGPHGPTELDFFRVAAMQVQLPYK